jgi:hypothetical protein
MSAPTKPVPEQDDDAAEVEALKTAIAESDADPRVIPHHEMRDWLLKVANGDFKTPPPASRQP